MGDHAWDRIPCSAVDREELGLPEVGVHLDLVHRRHHRRGCQQRGQVVGHEVADPDRADLAVGQQRLQRLVGADGEVELARQRLVQDQQVDLVDAELAGALVEGVQRLVVAVVGDPDLGLDEDLRAVDARSARNRRSASPTSRSLPYAAAVSMWR